MVDSTDLLRLLESLGLPADASPAALRADLDRDGVVTAKDLALMATAFGVVPAGDLISTGCWVFCLNCGIWMPCAEYPLPLGWHCVQFNDNCPRADEDELPEIDPDSLSTGPGPDQDEPDRRPPPRPSPAPLACDFDVAGPKFIGVLGSAVLKVMPKDPELNFGDLPPDFPLPPEMKIEWRITGGSQFIDPDNSTLFPEGISMGSIIILTARDTPGVITIEVKFSVDGVTCVRTHTLNVVQYDEVNIRYQAFIECAAVESPTGYFDGDGRTFAYTGSYRAQFDINFRTTDYAAGTSTQVLATTGAPFGQSFKYPATSIFDSGVSPCPLTIIGPHTKTATLTATPLNHLIEYVRGGSNSGTLLLFLKAENPLSFSPITWAIDAIISVGIEQIIDPQDGKQSYRYVIDAWHDGFPAHEFYLDRSAVPVISPNGGALPVGIVGGQSLYSPVVAGVTPFQLCFGPLGADVQWRAIGVKTNP